MSERKRLVFINDSAQRETSEPFLLKMSKFIYTNDYLLDKKVRIFQPVEGYRASTDAVLLSAAVGADVKNIRILDVGSGTGAVSLCLAHRLKECHVQIYGLELQEDLATLSDMSARENNFDFLKYYQADIRTKLQLPEIKPCSFDIVVTNPPYSEHDMPSPKTSKATAHNLHDFDLNGWLLFCLKMLKPFGRLYMVHRSETLPQICYTFYRKAGDMQVIPIYSKAGQPAKRIVVSVRKDAKTPCRIAEPFVMHDSDGNYTPAAQKILRGGCSFEQL